MSTRKQRPDGNQSALNAEQTEALMEACRTMGYYRAGLWAREHLGHATTTASLCRWYRRHTSEQTRGALRRAVEASKDFDAELDARNMDARAKNALSVAYWDAIQAGDAARIQAFGKLMLDFAKSDQNAARLDLEQRRVAELEASNKLAREKFEATEARIGAAAAKLEQLNKSGAPARGRRAPQGRRGRDAPRAFQAAG